MFANRYAFYLKKNAVVAMADLWNESARFVGSDERMKALAAQSSELTKADALARAKNNFILNFKFFKIKNRLCH